MAATKSKSESASLTVLDQMVEDGETAEQLLQAIVGENRAPRYEELNYFEKRLGWTKIQIQVELGRVTRALRDRAIAGTETDRDAQKVEADKSSELLLTEGSSLKDQIEKLQSKLNGLERSARLSSSRLVDMQEAVGRLRLHAPKYRRDEHATRLAYVGGGIGTECLAVEGEIRFMESMVSYSDLSEQSTIETIEFHFGRHAPELIEFNQLFGRKKVNATLWHAKQSELRSQLEELRPKAIALREQYDNAIEAIDCLLDYYIE